MPNLVEHARTELELLGEEPETIKRYLKVIQAFADMGHSGGSASVAIPVINRLLQFKNLKPITDNPNEWLDTSTITGGTPGLWQNKRNSTLFSKDAGKTYWSIEDRSPGSPDFAVSEPHRKEV